MTGLDKVDVVSDSCEGFKRVRFICIRLSLHLSRGKLARQDTSSTAGFLENPYSLLLLEQPVSGQHLSKDKATPN